MRNDAIAVVVIVVVIAVYSYRERRKKKIAAARDTFLAETDRLDITREEAEYFLKYLDQNGAKKRTVDFYHAALEALHAHVTVPRSQSRDRRPIEQIPPHTSLPG